MEHGIFGALRGKLLQRGIVFDYRSDVGRSVLLSSMGRSGSTFVARLLTQGRRWREMYEPFNHEQVREMEGFVYPEYVSPGSHQVRLEDAARAVFTGRLRSAWSDRANGATDGNQVLVPTHRLIKDIRTNLILGWLKQIFPELPVILLVRHPGAVIHSWGKAGFGHEMFMQERLLSQSDLVDEHISAQAPLYEQADTDFERMVFAWCVHYFVPFRQFAADEIYVLFYEDMVSNPEQELKSLAEFLQEPYAESALEILSSPSFTARPDSAIRSGESLINSWRKHYTSSELTRMNEIMSLFGMEDLYSVDSRPSSETLRKLMRTTSSSSAA